MSDSRPTAMPTHTEERTSLVEALDRLLCTGAVVNGELAISVADVDLIYVGLRALVRSSVPEDIDLRTTAGFATSGEPANSRGDR